MGNLSEIGAAIGRITATRNTCEKLLERKDWSWLDRLRVRRALKANDKLLATLKKVTFNV
jgi:hypothetical protein